MLTTEQYLLTCLMEECAEVSKRCSKAIRFGLDEKQAENFPVEAAGSDETNRERISYELTGLLAVADTLRSWGVIPAWEDVDKKYNKLVKLQKFMGYSRSVGTLDAKKTT